MFKSVLRFMVAKGYVYIKVLIVQTNVKQLLVHIDTSQL